MMIQEFMDFMLKNNVIGIAVGLLIATKVGEVVKSLIEDLVTPLILAPVFKKMKVENLEGLSARGVLYGKVIARVIEFIVVAFLVFLLVKNLGVTTS
jgi:large conductance mechanosensitive channel